MASAMALVPLSEPAVAMAQVELVGIESAYLPVDCILL
jgi:hypothetical protein